MLWIFGRERWRARQKAFRSGAGHTVYSIARVLSKVIARPVIRIAYWLSYTHVMDRVEKEVDEGRKNSADAARDKGKGY